MTKAQKETLRDCFEGCMSLSYAIGAAGIDPSANSKARDAAVATWRRWEREMDEEGCYTF